MRIVWAAILIASVRAQSLDPLTVDPKHYKLEIDNQWVRVIREQMAPRDTMPMHQHPAPGAVIVFLTARHNRLIAPDGTSRELRDPAGALMWSPASTHRSENLEAVPFEAVQIEPRRPTNAGKPAAPDKQDALLVDPKHYKLEFENEYVRVLRVNVGPHEKMPMHTHPVSGAVLVHLTDQNMRLTQADGVMRNNRYSAKQVRWVESAGTHMDENLSGDPLQFIRIELKFAVK